MGCDKVEGEHMKNLSLSILLVIVLAVPASATLVRGFSLQELRRESHCVVLGEVTESRSFWNQAGDVIYTEYGVDVERVVKGKASDRVVVRLMGGRVGDRELVISGNPSIAVGERVLLFLRDYELFHTVVGMSQGKWSVRRLDGCDHVYRGPAQKARPRQEGEIPLGQLLEMTLSSDSASH